MPNQNKKGESVIFSFLLYIYLCQKQANSLKKSSSSNLKNTSKYPDILSDFLKQILNKSDFL
jgi:hypothetical protein